MLEAASRLGQMADSDAKLNSHGSPDEIATHLEDEVGMLAAVAVDQIAEEFELTLDLSEKVHLRATYLGIYGRAMAQELEHTT